MKKKIISIIIFLILFPFFGINAAFAQGIGCTGDDSLGPIAKALCAVSGSKDQATQEAGKQLNNVISVLIGVMTGVAGIWFIFQFITAGYQWIQSGGDKEQLSQARDKITNSLIGLIIVVGAWIIIGIVGQILGLKILNPGQILLDLGK